MAWDDASQQVLLFGGSQGTYQSPTPLGDTWAWDGQNWTQLDDTGPSARHLFGIASDTTGNRIILFGGANPSNGNQQLLGDTWEWDGTVWSQQDETGPSPRMGQSMTYDSVRGRVVLFGGVGETAYLGDTWERNGNNWVRVSHFGPVTRAFAGLGFDGSECILFGGEIETLTSPASVFLGDTWSWDGRLWTQRQDIGPQARCSHAMTFDGSRKKMVLFGGSGRGTQTDLGDTWELAERSNPGG
ncbi:kelch repeat-containing protein [Paraburkholderia steynii]|nr:kelch repeat-containing protein [Paraburkholderia steynii]